MYLIFIFAVSPSIDKGQAGSKTVRTNRTAIWQIKCRGGKNKSDIWVIKNLHNGLARHFNTKNINCIWLTLCVSEPPPTFIWTHPHLGDLSSNEDFTVLHEEYQGGSTTTLVIHHAKNADAGTYSLTAENRNGKEKVDLDLIVLDTLPDCDCDMYKRADKMCTCSHSYTG